MSGSTLKKLDPRDPFFTEAPFSRVFLLARIMSGSKLPAQ